ncbi:hypothetical protein FRC01_001517 [Tulasnella sp. 417]|nr:hypothetical protein FRC01_001517 [Tulasnella sp. 417]
MEAYTTPGPYSIDLVRAVQRQMKFVDSMVGISWTDIGKFDSDSNELALKRAIAGYHAFLDIMAQNPDAFLVPTLSIDLAWHTHQLLCVNYRETTLDLVGTIVDHDDSVEQETLAAAFDQTARLWSSRFSVPYSTCGCPTARYTKSSAMDSMTKLFSKKGKQKAAPTEVENHRPDLICHHPNHVYETHPSDHSQVKVINSSSIAKQVAAREKLNKRRVEEDQGAVASGTADGWQGLAVRMRNDRGNGHDPAFSNLLSPDEILNAKAIPMGQCTMGLGMALKAVKALGKALKRGIPVERRKLRKYSWLPDVLRIEGSIIRRVVGPVFTVTLFAAGVVVCSEVYDYHLNLSNNVVPLLSVVVGLILVFRNTTSYDRYYEGRKDFAALTSIKIRAIKLLLSFVYAVMHHLRDEPGTDYEDYEGVLPQGFKYDAKELGIDRNSLLKKYATYSAMDRGHLGYAPKTRFRRHSSFKGFMGSTDAPKATNAPSSRTPLLEGDHATVEGSHATVEFHPRYMVERLPEGPEDDDPYEEEEDDD